MKKVFIAEMEVFPVHYLSDSREGVEVDVPDGVLRRWEMEQAYDAVLAEKHRNRTR